MATDSRRNKKIVSGTSPEYIAVVSHWLTSSTVKRRIGQELDPEFQAQLAEQKLSCVVNLCEDKDKDSSMTSLLEMKLYCLWAATKVRHMQVWTSPLWTSRLGVTELTATRHDSQVVR